MKYLNDIYNKIEKITNGNPKLKEMIKESGLTTREKILNRYDTEEIKNPAFARMLEKELTDLDKENYRTPFNSEIVDSEYKQQADLDDDEEEDEQIMEDLENQQQRWGEEKIMNENLLELEENKYKMPELEEIGKEYKNFCENIPKSFYKE